MTLSNNGLCFDHHQVSKWIRNSQENNGILVVTTLPSGNWMEPVTDTSAYLVIFSDDGRSGAASQYLGKQTGNTDLFFYLYLQCYIHITFLL